jgi:hypothetical protein
MLCWSRCTRCWRPWSKKMHENVRLITSSFVARFVRVCISRQNRKFDVGRYMAHGGIVVQRMKYSEAGCKKSDFWSRFRPEDRWKMDRRGNTHYSPVETWFVSLFLVFLGVEIGLLTLATCVWLLWPAGRKGKNRSLRNINDNVCTPIITKSHSQSRKQISDSSG